MDAFSLDQRPIVGALRDFQPLSFVMVTTKEEDLLWNHMVRTWHYLGYQAMIGPRIKYLVLYQDTLIAAISFNQASLRLGVRDAWLGLKHEHIRKLLPHILNNNRFLILPWVRIKNLASHVLAKALHLLKTDWRVLYGVEPYALETFVDFNRYAGTCYKAANWRYMGQTRGFGKRGKAFVFHGNRKGVFFYLLNQKLLSRLISQYPPRPQRIPRLPSRKPNPNLVKRARVYNMLLCEPDWSPEVIAEIGLKPAAIEELGPLLNEYMGAYSACYSRSDQQENGETYVKGLLSDLARKSIEPIALRYRDEKAVRTLQLFLKDSPWDHEKMKWLYQQRVLSLANDPNGMFTVDGSDFAKKGNKSAGVQRQYCGTKGKTDNCQAGVFVGYAGSGGYGLLSPRLYLPQKWFEPEKKLLWESCDIPETTVFATKPQLALAMIQELVEKHDFQYKWVGCDGAFGCDSEFRAGLPKSTWFFADIHSNQRIFKIRPQWSIPERNGRGKKPTRELPSVSAVSVTEIATDASVPWKKITLMEGSKGPVVTQIKVCRIIELQDGKDGEELWLYIRRYEDDSFKYALSNAPTDIELEELNHAATLRWPIEQSFQECKSFLGMDHYETRSYVGWHRHMLLVMVAHLFVLEVRFKFVKKNDLS